MTPDAITRREPRWKTAFLLCLFSGFLGAHRFYVGRSAGGLAQLVTFGGCGLWSAYDLVLLWRERFADGAGQPVLRANV